LSANVLRSFERGYPGSLEMAIRFVGQGAPIVGQGAPKKSDLEMMPNGVVGETSREKLV
jgi:hypothetical protein